LVPPETHYRPNWKGTSELLPHKLGFPIPSVSTHSKTVNLVESVRIIPDVLCFLPEKSFLLEVLEQFGSEKACSPFERHRTQTRLNRYRHYSVEHIG
jgi:hypothetical protein